MHIQKDGDGFIEIIGKCDQSNYKLVKTKDKLTNEVKMLFI